MKVERVRFSNETAGLAELENAQAACRLEHAMKLTQSGLVIGEIAKAKGSDQQVKRLRAKRQAKSVCFKGDSTQSVPLTAAKLLQSTAQHAMREIYREYRPRYCHAVSQKRQRKISRAAADVEDCSVGIGEGRAEHKCNATPPHAIDVRREHVIEKVVARRYRVEHLLYGLGCVYLILHADRLGAQSRHDLRASFACESM